MLTSMHRRWPCSDEAEFRILYVGNDLDLLTELRGILREPEYFIVSCWNRGSAILFVNSEARYNLLLFELEFEGRTGLELSRLARSLAHRRHLPIVILTANERIGELEELARTAGADEWLTKKDVPAISETMVRLLEEHAYKVVAED